MKRLLVLLLMLIFSVPGAALAQDTQPALVIPAGQREPGSVATVSQAIVIEGAVDGDVTSWSGDITVQGSVGGDVVSYAGRVTIAPGGWVGGHVLASGGELRVGGEAAVAGQAIGSSGGGGALASLLDLLMPRERTSAGATIGRALFGVVGTVLLAAFCLLYIAFWPRRIEIASATLQHFGARALALGLITTAAAALALPAVAALLISSVVGLPVLLVLLAGMLAAYIYGLAVLARWGAARMVSQTGRMQLVGNATFLAVALFALAIAGLVVARPLAGVAAFCLLASPGLGAAVLSRGGMALPLRAA